MDPRPTFAPWPTSWEPLLLNELNTDFYLVLTAQVDADQDSKIKEINKNQFEEKSTTQAF